MKVFSRIIIILILMFILIPIIFMVFNSFVGQNELLYRYTSSITKENKHELNNGKFHFVSLFLIPNKFSLKGYIDIIFKEPIILRTFLNSVFIAVICVLGNLTISSISSYGFSFLKEKNFKKLLAFYLFLIFLPSQITMVSQYFFQIKTNIENGVIFIILLAIFNPLGVLLLSLQIKNIPKEYILAAKIDGAGTIMIFLRIIIPLLKASLITLGFIVFSEYYNLVEQAMVFIKDDINQPLSFFLSNILKDNLGSFFSVSVFHTILPAFVFYFSNEYMKESLVNNVGLN